MCVFVYVKIKVYFCTELPFLIVKITFDRRLSVRIITELIINIIITQLIIFNIIITQLIIINYLQLLPVQFVDFLLLLKSKLIFSQNNCFRFVEIKFDLNLAVRV